MACCKAIIHNEFAGSSGRRAHDTDVSFIGFVSIGIVRLGFLDCGTGSFASAACRLDATPSVRPMKSGMAIVGTWSSA